MLEEMTSLVWTPTARAIEDRIALGDELILIISPFARVEALRRLLAKQRDRSKLKIVVRWRAGDLLSGASDLALYPFTLAEGCQMYVHDLIHLKLFVFTSNVAFSTSSNATLRGLGYQQLPNIETGVTLRLSVADWIRIHGIVAASRRVDDAMFQSLSQYVDTCLASPPRPPPPSFSKVSKLYSIASLPATESPSLLEKCYFEGQFPSPEEERRATHDFFTFRLPANLDVDEFNEALRLSFRLLPFVTDFVEFLKSQGSLRFGSVNDWIHQKCEDVPLPYRWEIKENTRIFYNWLAYFFAEIDWNIPGAYSQVIYWNDSAAQQADGAPGDHFLERFQRQFARLMNREQATEWVTISHGGAPHQPLLLLAVTELYEKNPERDNLIVLDSDLQKRFLRLFSTVVDPKRSPSIPMPFIALRTEPFWELIPRPGGGEIPAHIRAQTVFEQYYEGARLDEHLHALLALPNYRRALQETLLQTYFPEPVQERIRQICDARSMADSLDPIGPLSQF